MSSHHIIREDQEPALVIDNTSPENLDTIQQLLEWSPTVIVTERALEQVLSWGIKIDIVITLQQRVEILKKSLHDQLPLKVLSCASENEAPETALYYLTASKQKAVNIISEAALESFEQFPSLDIAVIQSGKRWVFIRNGHFEKWLPKGTALMVYSGNENLKILHASDSVVGVKEPKAFWVAEVM